jgi:sigma-E factor negative regulatory protein RseB
MRRSDRVDQEHFVFSDGLATISVYVDPDGEMPLRGAAQLGALHALGRSLGDYQITLVGEVPQRALEILAEGMQPVAE